MRITIVVHQLKGGGAEHVASLWAKGFVENGDEVTVALFNKEVPVVYQVNAPIKYFNSSKKNHILRLIEIIINLRKIFIETRPDVIISILHPIGLWSYAASRGLGVPVIHTEHDSFERPKAGVSKLSWKTKLYKFYVNKLFSAITVLTRADKEFIGRRLKKVFVLPNPLAYKPATIMPKKKNIVLAVGRVEAWHVKGFDNLVRAWEKVEANRNDWVLQIAGDYTDESKNYLLGLMGDDIAKGRVKFVGFNRDIAPLYKDAGIFVLSSRYEGFGMVLVEAMSQGCACIACDYKGRQKEIIPSSEYGIICPSEDENAIATALASLMDDSKLRVKLQQNSIERSKEYSLDIIMSKWFEIFKILKIQ